MSQLKNINTPMVSVCMITYNHEAFIAEAIEGVLMQQTSFPIKLIIGEDHSTDNTRAICEEYEIKHPDVIELLPKEEQNLGMTPNFIKTLKACTNKYIAICEGDDYWIDPLKLQMQVDFLERNADYSLVCTSFKTNYKVKVNNSLNEHDILLEKNIIENNIRTCTTMFRKYLLFKDAKEINFITCDLVLFSILLNSMKGRYLDVETAFYRSHNQGEYSSLNHIKKIEFQLNAYEQLKLIPSLSNIINLISKIIIEKALSVIAHTNKSEYNNVNQFFFKNNIFIFRLLRRTKYLNISLTKKIAWLYLKRIR